MIQKKKQKLQTVVKSNCGTFIVDPLTTSSQSSDTDGHTLDDRGSGNSGYLQELKKNIKKDLAEGKNKLSNIFHQQTLHTKKRGLKRKLDENCEEETTKKPARKHRKKKSKEFPADLLDKLSKKKGTSRDHQFTDSAVEESVEPPRKIRKRIKVKSAVAEEGYIPCVTGGATHFGLSRLDKDCALATAEKAAKFRTDQLYGGTVRRITIMDFEG